MSRADFLVDALATSTFPEPVFYCSAGVFLPSVCGLFRRLFPLLQNRAFADSGLWQSVLATSRAAVRPAFSLPHQSVPLPAVFSGCFLPLD